MSRANARTWYRAGLHFECIQCGRCCSGPGEGYIWVSKAEIRLIAEYLKMPEEQLRRTYLKRVGFRTTIIENKSRDCIFLEDRGGAKSCAIYPVRPNQCRTWPFWSENLADADAWNRAGMKCPGINRGKLYSYEEIRAIKKSKWWRDERTGETCRDSGRRL